MPGNQNDRDFGKRFFDGMGKTQPITIRHLHVGYDQIQALSKLLNDLATLDAISSFDGLKILLLKNRGDVAPNRRVIVYNE